MKRHSCAQAGIMTTSISCATTVAFILFVSVAVCGQERAGGRQSAAARGPLPSLPEVVTKRPDWIGKEAPFDLAKFFAAPPAERNAAPLYLDALFEFEAAMQVCFPPGPERDRRSQEAKDRWKRYYPLSQQLERSPASVSAAAIDDLVRLYDAGFRKLTLAQRRDQCVFEVGLGMLALTPHHSAARHVAWITSLRVRQDIERGDLSRAIAEIDRLLRLARDLEPRGNGTSQLVVAAITRDACTKQVTAILAGRGLHAQHCDRLIDVLTGHEAKAIDSYAEGLRADYLNGCATMHDLVERQPEIAKALGLTPGQSVVTTLGFLILSGPRGAIPLPANIDALVAQTKPAEMAQHVALLGRFYRALLDLDGTPCAARIEKIAALKMPHGNEPMTRVLDLLTDPTNAVDFARATAGATTVLRAMECLVAIRRWQLSHRELPRDLASVVRGARLKHVPADPYDGRPLRLVVLDGEPAVYSVGKDGKDDGGQTDSNNDKQPGDLIYRLAPHVARRR
jgi:hypothetical protein